MCKPPPEDIFGLLRAVERKLSLRKDPRTEQIAVKIFVLKVEGDVIMGNSNKILKGQGIIANTVHGRDMIFQQAWTQSGIDPLQLAKELAQLRATMKQESEGTSEQDEAIGVVAAAEKAAAQGDGPTALGYLKTAGEWTLGVAEKIGVAVAAKAIASAMGMPA